MALFKEGQLPPDFYAELNQSLTQRRKASLVPQPHKSMEPLAVLSNEFSQPSAVLPGMEQWNKIFFWFCDLAAHPAS